LRLSIIIVNYNSWNDITRQVSHLTSLSAFNRALFEIVVVDNNSPDSIPYDRKQVNGLKWIDLKTNGGFSVGVNTGAANSSGDWLLILNPDTVVENNTVEDIFLLLDKHEQQNLETPSVKTGIIGIKLTNPDGSLQPSSGTFPSLIRIALEIFIPGNRRRYNLVSAKKPVKTDWVTGAFFLINRECYNETEGFCEDYFLYFEETDFCYRAGLKHWNTLYDPTMSVCHLNPLQNRKTTPYIRIITRHSRMLYFLRNRSKKEFILMTLIIFIESVMRQILCQLSGEKVQARAWQIIRKLSRAFLKNSYPKGTAVSEAALQIFK